MTDSRVSSAGWLALQAGAFRVAAALGVVHGVHRLGAGSIPELICVPVPGAAWCDGIASGVVETSAADHDPAGFRSEIGSGAWLIGSLVLSDCPYAVGDLASYLEGGAAPAQWRSGALVLARRGGFGVALRVDAVSGPYVPPARIRAFRATGSHRAVCAAQPVPGACDYDLRELLLESALLLGCERASRSAQP